MLLPLPLLALVPVLVPVLVLVLVLPVVLVLVFLFLARVQGLVQGLVLVQALYPPSQALSLSFNPHLLPLAQAQATALE